MPLNCFNLELHYLITLAICGYLNELGVSTWQPRVTNGYHTASFRHDRVHYHRVMKRLPTSILFVLTIFSQNYCLFCIFLEIILWFCFLVFLKFFNLYQCSTCITLKAIIHSSATLLWVYITYSTFRDLTLHTCRAGTTTVATSRVVRIELILQPFKMSKHPVCCLNFVYLLPWPDTNHVCLICFSLVQMATVQERVFTRQRRDRLIRRCLCRG